ncbi:MAG: bifunctional oligoribonuclease/PAP phosphatase NrnA [Eubacterium sp.]|nr:bifunctional oligoribonuclease/PAP phosphatase NrnA [Eubacterium sp.]
MKKNDTLAEIGAVLAAAQDIALFPHVNMDGDAIGSCVALCLALKARGKNAFVLLDEAIPENLRFLENGCCEWDLEKARDIEVAVTVDSGDLKRIGVRGEVFLTAKTKVCLDHHGSSTPYCDYNYIDPEEAATGQIIYDLLMEMGEKGNAAIGEALYAAIVTDTGKFQYSNTQKKSHLIAADLLDWGIDANKVSVEIYESNRPERIRIESLAIGGMEVFLDGQLVIAKVTQEMLRETGAGMEETDQIVSALRTIRGVETSILLKEYEPKVIKASCRSKHWFDVSKISQRFGGGGHVRAAGFTLYCTIDEAFETVKEVVSREMTKEQEGRACGAES